MVATDAQVERDLRRMYFDTKCLTTASKRASRVPTSNGEETSQPPVEDSFCFDLEEQMSRVESLTSEASFLESIQDEGMEYSYYYFADDDDAQELHEAAIAKDADVLADVVARISEAKALSQRAILLSLSPLKDTLLHAAPNAGNTETLALIFSLSHDHDHDHDQQSILLTKQNLKGDTALHVAAKGRTRCCCIGTHCYLEILIT